MIEIKVPELGESIQEVQISQWLKREGEWVEKDENLVELESEKAAQSLAAPVSGIVKRILCATGEFAPVGRIIAEVDETAAKGTAAPSAAAAPAAKPSPAPTPAPAPVVAAPAAPAAVAVPPASAPGGAVMPAAERLLEEYKISADKIQGTGPGGRVLKEDVLRYIERQGMGPGAKPSEAPASAPRVESVVVAAAGDRREEIKPMSMIRRTIAARLVQAQHTAALLTTFNEIDMKPVMELRNRYKDKFAEIHGVKLGFMSFFAKACVEGLKKFPSVNSEIRGNDIVVRHYHDIGVAIGGGKGLVVPVLRNVESMSFAAIERRIGEFAEQAKANKIKPQDLEGGTFTISNGGVYGSLLSTPIVNPPQSGILGMHSIQERPVALEGQVVIRPMMYIALTYDHRIIDGREAVGFLRTIKEVLEEPARLFLEV